MIDYGIPTRDMRLACAPDPKRVKTPPKPNPMIEHHRLMANMRKEIALREHEYAVAKRIQAWKAGTP